MSDICFIDTESLGLHPDAPTWEFAAVRRFEDGHEDRVQFFIRHDPGHWPETLPQRFREDYEKRYSAADAIDPSEAAIMIHLVTRSGHPVICNPLFDLPRLETFLRHHGITPEWHYHPDDISSMAKGYLGALRRLPPPERWKSDLLSAAVGVDPADYARHTAMGDVQWAIAQWEIITGTDVAADCTCSPPPFTDGPDEFCPQHGRPYTEVVELLLAARAELADAS